MSWRASAYVKALLVCPNGERITRTEKLVALVLADSHQDKGEGTYPAVRTIAEDALMDERVCRRMLGALERKGVIVRRRAANQGRGQITFYLFPALDSRLLPAEADAGEGSTLPAVKKSAAKGSTGEKSAVDASAKQPNKGGQDVPLPAVDFLPKRRTEGGRKGDKTGLAYIEEQEQEQKQKPPSKSPASGGRAAAADKPAVEHAIDTVMVQCGFASKRLRIALGLVIESEVDKGIHPNTTALAMSAAWKDYEASKPRLRWTYGGPKRFFEDGAWRNRDSWPWEKPDKAELERQRLHASQGMTYQVN